MNYKYNIAIPPCRKTINYSEVKSLSVFGDDEHQFDIGHKALLVLSSATREWMLQYALDSLWVLIVETVAGRDGEPLLIIQMRAVVID